MINPFTFYPSKFKTVLLLLTILISISVISIRTFASDSQLPNGNIRLLVLGDSLSAGYGISQSQAWVTLLQQRLRQSGHAVAVINASVSGETSLGGLNRLPALLRQHQPQLLILELGANDGLRGLPIEVMQANLQKIIHQAKQKDIRVLLLGMQLPPNYGPSYTRDFAQTYHKLAKQNQIELLPFFLADIVDKRELMQADDLHPNSKAQPLILKNVWPYVEKLLSP
jgi:acyl-CoA thioesterase-1